jgi:hypothetical protein
MREHEGARFGVVGKREQPRKRKTAATKLGLHEMKKTSNQQRSNEQSTQTQQSKILNESARLKRVAGTKV